MVLIKAQTGTLVLQYEYHVMRPAAAAAAAFMNWERFRTSCKK